MKNILTYSACLSFATLSHASTIAVDNFDDNSIDSSLWDSQVHEKDDPSAQDLSLVESSQRLNFSIDTAPTPDVPAQSSIRQSLTTNVSASVSWSATVDIVNNTDVNLDPSLRLGFVVSDSTRVNFGGIYLKAENEGRRIQNAEFIDVSPTPASVVGNGTVRLNYDHISKALTVGYANGIGNSVVDYESIDTSTWANTATNGFRFHLQGTVAGTPSGTGDVYYENFSIQTVPEPSSTLLLAFGIVPLFRRQR